MTTYFVRHRETIGRHVARLYSINTLGRGRPARSLVYALTAGYAEAVEGFEYSLAINPVQPEVRERLRELQPQVR